MTQHEETDAIIGCAMHVHRSLGPGLRESPYENALMIALKNKGFRAEQQFRFPIRSEGEVVGDCAPDITVERKILIEAKAIDKLGDNEVAQVLNYLRIANLDLALLINFKHESLEWKRMVR